MSDRSPQAVAVGDEFADNDSRMEGRRVKVQRIEGDHAVVWDGCAMRWILLRRLLSCRFTWRGNFKESV